MNLMLDTHILLWAFNADPRLDEKTIQLICDPRNTIYYSVISMWEVSLKHSKHPDKMNTSGTLFMHYCEQAGYKKLPVDERHVVALETLQVAENAPAHKDPFDRMLLAQAKADAMTFITHDSKFSGYKESNVMLV